MRDPRENPGHGVLDLKNWSSARLLTVLRKIKPSLVPASWTCDVEASLEQAEFRIGSENSATGFLLKVRAVADMLVSADRRWMKSSYLRDRFFSVTGLSWDRAGDFSWSFVPCFLADGTDACVRHLLCGLARDGRGELLISPWSRHLFDPLFIQSMEKAHEMFLDRGDSGPTVSFCVFPLSEPLDYALFCGDSAGLPVYLCGRQLLEGKTWPENLAATGRLEDGRIAEVGHIREKMAEAEKSGARIFLYPASNLPPDQEGNGSMICLPADDVSWAHCACDLGRSDPEHLHRFLDILSSPRQFAAFCGDIPDSATSLADRAVARLVPGIISAPDLFERFSGQMETLMVSGRYSYASFLVSRFNPGIEKAGNLTPVHDLKWSVFNLELANHRGDVASARFWSDRAGRVKVQALKHPAGRGLDPWVANHGFVAACHNHYNFRPEMVQGLAVLAEKVEHFLLYSIDAEDGVIEPSLGAIYGTMAQHFGFCGPAYLQETLRFSKKAMERFGGTYGEPEFSSEKASILRQYNYITYAFLDAGNTEEARRHLLLYLEQPDLESVAGRLDVLSDWELALVARYMADRGDGPLVAACVEFAGKARENRVAQSHPWQLWCLNMARCALKTGDTRLARELAFQSLDICRSARSGDAMNVMALLPLSFLYAQGLAPLHDLAPHYKATAETALGLNPDHFSALNPQDCKAGLADISRRPAAFFPFSYR